VQEATNATPIKALIKTTMYFFIGCQFQFESRRMFGCLKSSQAATNEALLSADAAQMTFSAPQAQQWTSKFCKAKTNPCGVLQWRGLKIATKEGASA
jgi:hypothetical protein